MFSGWSVLCIMLAKPSFTLWFDKTEARISDSAVEISSRFLCHPTAFCSTCWSRGTSGWEREHIHISGDSSPICKRHIESMLKGIKSYLCLVQTGHVDIEEFRCGRKGGRHTNM
jgi:hypothetical protein